MLVALKILKIPNYFPLLSLKSPYFSQLSLKSLFFSFFPEITDD